MKFLIVDHYYPQFLEQYYSSNTTAKDLPYKSQLKKLLSESFGTADFYSHALTMLGHEATDIVVNNDRLQEKWVEGHRLPGSNIFSRAHDTLRSYFPFVSARKASMRQLKVLEAQISEYQPDVLYVHNISYIPTWFLKKMKKQVKLIVGQIAAPIPPLHTFRGFDLIITSLPHFVAKFRKMGLKAEYLPLCFDPRVLTKTPPKRVYPITFVGSFFSMHSNWISTLSKISKVVTLKIWGSPDPKLSVYQGEAWGKDMYLVLQKSRITLNRHSIVAGEIANNMRLFEATGCGAMLITDAKSNLADFFVPGKEVVAYHSTDELVILVKYYCQHSEECARIAQAGQRRTLRDHTYAVRMQELIKIIERNI